MQDLAGKVAVVTGGASGVGKGLAQALLDHGMRLVIADVEVDAIDRAVIELGKHADAAGLGGTVEGVRTDVSDPESVAALADQVYDRYGACHLLCNNAGVTSGGGGKPWEQEYNDWRWCYSVNVFGVANGALEFVPRMLASGEPGVVMNTSSGDGGFAPVPFASVYASSKAAVSCFTEALAHQLAAEEGARVRACVFYPSGGLLDTGLWTAQRNRPSDLARTKEREMTAQTTFAGYRDLLESMGRPADVMDTYELGRFAVEGIRAGHYIISFGLDDVSDLLHKRADAIARAELPPPLH